MGLINSDFRWIDDDIWPMVYVQFHQSFDRNGKKMYDENGRIFDFLSFE